MAIELKAAKILMNRWIRAKIQQRSQVSSKIQSLRLRTTSIQTRCKTQTPAIKACKEIKIALLARRASPRKRSSRRQLHGNLTSRRASPSMPAKPPLWRHNVRSALFSIRFQKEI